MLLNTAQTSDLDFFRGATQNT